MKVLRAVGRVRISGAHTCKRTNWLLRSLKRGGPGGEKSKKKDTLVKMGFRGGDGSNYVRIEKTSSLFSSP